MMKNNMRKMTSFLMALLLITSLPLTVLALEVDNSYGDVTIGDTHVDHYDSGGNAQNSAHEGSVTVVHGSGDKNGTVTVTAGSEDTPVDVNIVIATGPDTVTNVVLNDAHIDTSSGGGAALEIAENSEAVIELNGTNTLTSGTVFGLYGCAGLQVNAGNSVTIQDAGGASGSLTATGSQYGAGIGSEDHDVNRVTSSGKITITGGTVTATGGDSGAGIGGGWRASGSNITITGGTVTATGGDSGAGIGGGFNGNGSDITISGGTVTATGGDYGAGIGGGYNGDGSGIAVKDSANVTVTGKHSAADIGDGGAWDDGEKKPSEVNTDGLYTTGSITYSDGTTVWGSVPAPVDEGDTADNATSAPAQGETFWGSVLKQLRGAEKGSTVTVDAGKRTTMPASVAEAVKECGVTLVIQWDGGEDITIDAGFDKEATGGIYLLADL